MNTFLPTMITKKILPILLSLIFTATAFAQVENAGAVRKRSDRDKKNEPAKETVTKRMEGFFETKDAHEADVQYMREIYRELDLNKPENSPLYFPEDAVDGKGNLFHLMLTLVVEGKLPAYEFLDGREDFSEKYRINVADMLERFGIYAQEAKGSTAKAPKFTIDDSDVPTTQVLCYYIIEKWEFDRRTNRMKTRVEAICPVLTRSGDYGGNARYPMFWMKYDSLRPYLAQQYVFLSDDNNLAQYSLDDYFNMDMYNGEIYKTRNLRNKSMAELFPDEDMRKQACDSIDNRLRSYGKDLWVPSREEYLAMKEREAESGEKATAADKEIPEKTTVEAPASDADATAKKRTSTKKRATKSSAPAEKKQSVKKPKVSSSSSSQSASKSVRRKKR